MKSITEAVQCDIREMPICKSSLEDYASKVKNINDDLNALTDEKKSYIDWVGKSFRELFNEAKYDITVSINGKEAFIRGVSFSDEDLAKITNLGLTYHLDVVHDNYGNVLCLGVELW